MLDGGEEGRKSGNLSLWSQSSDVTGRFFFSSWRKRELLDEGTQALCPRPPRKRVKLAGIIYKTRIATRPLDSSSGSPLFCCTPLPTSSATPHSATLLYPIRYSESKVIIKTSPNLVKKKKA